MTMKINKLIGAALGLLLLACGTTHAQFTDQRNYAGTSGGSANAQTITIPNMGSVVPAGVPLRFIPGFANTTTATLTVSGGSAATAICKPSPAGPVALSGGELQTTQTTEVVWNGTCYLITSSVDSTASTTILEPQGYLTPCPAAGGVSGCTAGTLVPTGDVSGVGTLYYTPAVGNQIPIYNGSRLVNFTFSEITLTLGSSNLSNTIYDVCAFNNGGSVQVGTTVAWTTSTAGSGARGTGAATAQISRVNGTWVNAVSATVKNGANTYTVAASQCTMLGTIFIGGGGNGLVTFTRTYGQSRQWNAWNFYNRLPLFLKAGDSTASWLISSNTAFRPSDNSASNVATILNGLTEEIATATYNFRMNGSASNIFVSSGIGFNSTTTASGLQGITYTSATFETLVGTAWFQTLPTLGINSFTPLESVSNIGSSTVSVAGTEAKNVLNVWWRG